MHAIVDTCDSTIARDRADRAIDLLHRQMREHPRQCVFTMMDLSCDLDYQRPAGEAPPAFETEWLRATASEIWATVSRALVGVGTLSVEYSPSCESGVLHDRYAMVVHLHHDEKILCGRAVGQKANRDTAALARSLILRGHQPRLAIVYAGDNADDLSYRRELGKQAAGVGVSINEIAVAAAPSSSELHDVLDRLNHDPLVDAVLVQTIRDAELNRLIRQTLCNSKDPEFINMKHMGQVMASHPELPVGAPCTAVAIRSLIHDAIGQDLRGKHVVILNGTEVIGRPLSVLLSNDGATPTVCNRYTGESLPTLTKMAHVIVTATARRGVLQPSDVNPGSLVIDAAVIRKDGTVCGDLDTEAMMDVVGKITPVPGGVGPVTVATLLNATVKLAKLHHCKRNGRK